MIWFMSEPTNRN